MSNPLAEVILSVEVKVKVTDTESNETKEVTLGEHANVGKQSWIDCYRAVGKEVFLEMDGMVSALEEEQVKKQ